MAKNKFLVLILIFSSVALLKPEWFIWIKPHIPILLGIIMFGMGITLNFSDLSIVWQSPRLLVAGLLFQYVLMPLIAWCIGVILQLPVEMLVGLVIVGSCPGGTASNVVCYLAKGNLALSITLTLLSTALAPLVTPIVLFFLLNEEIEINFISLMQTTFWIVLFPLLDGLIIRHFFKNKLKPYIQLFPSISIVSIGVVIACVVALNQRTLLNLPVLLAFAVILHNGIGLISGYSISKLLGFSESTSRTLSIETGMQNSGLAVALASAHFSPLTALPGAIFSFWHNFSGVLLANYWSRKSEEAENS